MPAQEPQGVAHEDLDGLRDRRQKTTMAATTTTRMTAAAIFFGVMADEIR